MKRKVLFIDNDPATMQLVKLIVEKGGYDVIGAEGGAEGLELIAQDRPDVVLLDLMMPGMNGWEVYRHMKDDEQMKDIPVIVVTAKAQQLDRAMGLHVARVQDYITKPFTPDQLLNSIHSVLGDDQ